MDTKERYGRFVLQFEDARTSAGSFFRAVQLGPTGYERHVQLFRSEPMSPEALRNAAEGLKKGIAVQHAQVVRGLEAGVIDRCAFATFDVLEGRSVGALIEASRAERHPFAADHALLIASKTAAALEAAQGRKQMHGFLTPEFVQVSHDGEVSVRGFGLPPRILRDANCVGVREAGFLAPEVDTAVPLDIRADVFSLGAQLFEMLTGAALARNQPVTASLLAARILVPGGDGTPIPKALGALLLQALAEDPAARFKDATAFKKAVDTLLFSGDYSPTTFNLAFFMHTLFRDEGDEDAARIKAERNADYRQYLSPLPPTAAGATVSETRPAPPAPPVSSTPAPSPVTATSPRVEAPPRSEPVRADAARTDTTRSSRTVPPVPQRAPEEPLFQTVLSEKKSFSIGPVIIGVIAALGIGGYFLTRSGGEAQAPATSPTMNAAETAALARVKELEARLAALEAEKVAAEQSAADEAKKKVEAQARARGRAVDPVELQKAQDEARKKVQADQETKLAGERQKIEEERKRAEETRAAEAAKTPEGTPSPAPAPPASSPASAAVTPTQAVPAQATPAPAESPAPAASPAAAPAAVAPPAAAATNVLDLSDPGVTPPQLVSQSRVEYPPMARSQRITGTVMISALVDEQGNVAEARIIRGAVAANAGLNQAALESVKKRKYRPAMSNGKAGRAWIAIQIEFKL